MATILMSELAISALAGTVKPVMTHAIGDKCALEMRTTAKKTTRAGPRLA